jgi:hypothetical protein
MFLCGILLTKFRNFKLVFTYVLFLVLPTFISVLLQLSMGEKYYSFCIVFV